mmetsp:Transcript_11154/g.30825  ORF Transcript_11154/g.30825 Transcript_11154/m.30825 type:complete len:590 (-) Transcript_11154:232-2001(-)
MSPTEQDDGSDAVCEHLSASSSEDEQQPKRPLRSGTSSTSPSLFGDASCLDEKSFPQFAPLLAATQDYAAATGSRFRASSWDVPVPADSPDACRYDPEIFTNARPLVREFAERLLSGDRGLHEELQRASCLVMVECVRNGVVATCRRLEVWPPWQTRVKVDPDDCSYEDMSAPLDVIAQRAFNDEARRQNLDADVSLARRALTASYLVDFAHEVGAKLPKVSPTFAEMFAALDTRAAEWEGEQNEGVPSMLPTLPVQEKVEPLRRSFDLRLAAARLLARSPSLGDLEKVGPRGHWLILDSMSVKPKRPIPRDCDSKDGEELRLYVTVTFDGNVYRTVPLAFNAEEPCLHFGKETVRFPYLDQEKVNLQVRSRRTRSEHQFRALSESLLEDLYKDDPIIGELTIPLGDELKDLEHRVLDRPLTLGTLESGEVSLQLMLQETDDPAALPRKESEASIITTTSSGALAAVGGVVSKVGATINSYEGRARDAMLLPRSGFGTCERDEASVIIVTEELSGWCFYYCYATRAEAEVYFRARMWRICSRIMFRCRGGAIVEELCRGGPSWAWGTIRKAAWTLQIDNPSTDTGSRGP